MKALWLSAFVASALLTACSSSSDSPLAATADGTASVSWTAAPMSPKLAGRAAVAARAEEGGKLVVSLSNPTLLVWQSDTLPWDGSDSLQAGFGQLPVGSGYRLVAQYLDPKGLCTHTDSVPVFSLARAQTLPLRLVLAPVLGKIYLQFPEIPDAVDSLGLFVQGNGREWKAISVRPTGNRGALRVDSLPIGAPLAVRLRAWKKTGDTLFFLDTSVVLTTGADNSLAWNLQSALARSQAWVSFAPGGEVAATVGFVGTASAAVQAGGLIFTGFSDSGTSDWARLRNASTDSFCQTVRISRGALDTAISLRLAAGEEAIVTRAGKDMLAQAGHPLQAAQTLTAGIATVTWSATGGTVWKLESADGKVLFDQVYVLPGKNGWPSLNTSTHRTVALRRTNTSASGNDAGSGWCSQAIDDPAVACRD